MKTYGMVVLLSLFVIFNGLYGDQLFRLGFSTGINFVNGPGVKDVAGSVWTGRHPRIKSGCTWL